MRMSLLRSIDWVSASSDPAMVLQMSLADELSRCSLDTSLLPHEHRAHTFVNIYNLLFLFSCILHKAHPSALSASEQNEFFSRRHHCLSFEMVCHTPFCRTSLHALCLHLHDCRNHRSVSTICFTVYYATTRCDVVPLTCCRCLLHPNAYLSRDP